MEITVNVPPVFAPLFQPMRYKGAWGGRGSGKSHAFAIMAVLRASREPGLRVLCVREVQGSLNESVKFLLESYIRKFNLPGFRILYSHIETPGGGRILFEGMQNHTADSIKSLEGADICWVEEAHALSLRSFDLLRPTIRKPGSELWFSWNPEKETDPVDEFFRGDAGAPPNSIVVNANYTDNPYFPDVLRQDMEWDRDRDPDKYAHIWLGGYKTASAARVFHNWTVEEFDTPGEPGAKDKEPLPRFLFGADWGFSVDPSVLVRCWIDEKANKLFVDQEAYKVGCPIEKTPDLFLSVPGSNKWPIIADSARPETIDYMKRNGFPQMRPAKKGAGSVEDGIEFLKNFDIVVHPRCKHTADELAFYKFKVDRKTEEILPVLEDKKNHVIDSLRYAVETLRRNTQAKTVGVHF